MFYKLTTLSPRNLCQFQSSSCKIVSCIDVCFCAFCFFLFKRAFLPRILLDFGLAGVPMFFSDVFFPPRVSLWSSSLPPLRTLESVSPFYLRHFFSFQRYLYALLDVQDVGYNLCVEDVNTRLFCFFNFLNYPFFPPKCNLALLCNWATLKPGGATHLDSAPQSCRSSTPPRHSGEGGFCG